MMWLTGCGGPSVKYVPVKPVPISAEWLASTAGPLCRSRSRLVHRSLTNLQLLAVI